MNTKKKTLLFLLITVVAIVAVSVVTVTYAWFLSRYSENYDFELESKSHVVLRYESTLNFASGNANTASNHIVVAAMDPATPLSSTLLSPLDLFDTTKVRSAAQAVKVAARGAYWYGNETRSGALAFSLTAKPQNNSNYDLVYYGELEYVAIFEYLGHKFLLFDGNYYTNSTQVTTTGGETYDLVGTPLTLSTSATAFGSDGVDPWYPIPADTVITEEVTISDSTVRKDIFVNGLLLLPNTRFAYTLYVFAAKGDDLMDQAWNGQTISLEATISVPNPNA